MHAVWRYIIASIFLLGAGSANAQPSISVGVPSLSMFTIMYHVAEDKGFFAKEGVSVEIKHFESGSINMKALLVHATDVADVEVGLILSAAANGGDLRIIGTQSQRLHFALYAKRDINSLKDLDGRTFAIAGPGGLTHLVFLALFEKYGLDPNKVRLVSVGGTSARLSALAAGKVDATLGGFSPKIEAEPKLHRLMVISKELPHYMAQAIAVSPNTLATKGDALVRFQRALVEASRWAYANKDGVIQIAQKHLPASREDLSKTYDFYRLAHVWAINGEIDVDDLAYMQKLGIETKTLSSKGDLNKLVDLSVYKDVTASLGHRDYPDRN